MSNARFVGCRFFPGLVAVLISLNAAGCASSIARDSLLEWMQEGTAPLIVDVRSQGEYDLGHIPGAVHVPFYSVGSGLEALGASKKDPVVLYCEHGPRSGIAGFSLRLSGYEQVYSLGGSMKAWRANDFPIEKVVPPK